jgi:hypothetical protein
MDSGVSFSDGCCGSTSRRRKPILRLDEGGISHGARRAEERVSKSVEERAVVGVGAGWCE